MNVRRLIVDLRAGWQQPIAVSVALEPDRHRRHYNHSGLQPGVAAVGAPANSVFAFLAVAGYVLYMTWKDIAYALATAVACSAAIVAIIDVGRYAYVQLH
jgi:hypothetical protein